MSLSRVELERAFPNQPRLRAEFEQLNSLIDDAQQTLDSLKAQQADIRSALDNDARWQGASTLLSLIDSLNGNSGAVELLGADHAAIREIDSADPASLTSRASVMSFLGIGPSSSRPTPGATIRGIYLDTTLNAGGKAIFWGGSSWHDASGAAV